MTSTIHEYQSVTPRPPELAVHCRGVNKSYGAGATRVTALRGIDLDVRTGELLMLVGPSGCGKTTLISCIAGILDHDQGRCSVFGHDFKSMPQREKTRFRARTVGFVFQAFNLVPTLTAAQNVAVPLLINQVPRAKAIAKARDILDRVGLGARCASMPRELSGGEQQRVAIARALIHDPRIIVCDEPTSALDHETGHQIMEMLRSVAMRSGRSLVIVTHDARIFEFADRIAQMDDGTVQRVVDSPQELKN
jgi:putative ABC transport system ATP-binding protein